MEATSSQSGRQFTQPTQNVLFINMWSARRARLDRAVGAIGSRVLQINADAASTLFSLPEPDVVLFGFGGATPEAATFLVNYKASPWHRKVPLLALLQRSNHRDVDLCMEWGCDDAVLNPARGDHLRVRVRQWALRHRIRVDELRSESRAVRNLQRAQTFTDIIVPLGVAMMAEHDFDVLLETILQEARRFAGADGGTLYLLNEDDALEFKFMMNETLNIAHGVGSGEMPPIAPIPIYESGHGPKRVAAYVARSGHTVNIPDVYTEHEFDTSGVRTFDREHGYRTRSLLTIALRDHNNRVIGVLQLINAREEDSSRPGVFDELTQAFVESLSRLAGQALESYRTMAALRRRSGGLSIELDAEAQAKHVHAVTSSDYFQKLKRKASELRASSQPTESSTKA